MSPPKKSAKIREPSFANNAQAIRMSLLAWFRKQKRELPWRKTENSYQILVSEIMLQQTQVKTVIPYYRRWIESFPTVHKLASAEESQVLKHWEGLGYYSRAKNLKQSAEIIVTKFDGMVPETMEDLIRLPGIGRYTAGAILSIAFGLKVPVLDGNVKRVLSRLFRMNENGNNRESENRLWYKAGELVPEKNAGDFNQALMELGATLCLPKKPDCERCPLSAICESKLHGVQDKFPPAKTRAPAKKIKVSAGVILNGGKVYIQKRPKGGLMSGLWEFPGGKVERGETPEACLRREIKEELSIDISVKKKLMVINHSYTRFRVTLHVFHCEKLPGRIRSNACEQWQWVPLKDLKAYPFPAANVKIVESLINGHKIRKQSKPC